MSDSSADLQQKLLHKLRGGNKRFSHLNATIGRSRDKLDLLSLNLISPHLSEDFVNQLMSSSSMSFKISFKDIKSKLLDFINSQSDDLDSEQSENKTKNLELLKSISDTKKKLEFLEAFQKEEFSELGTKSFAFGYPLIVKQMRDKREDSICAPLFMWYLDITRDYRDDAVIISRTEDSPIIFNEMLDYYLETELKLDFSDDVQTINNEMLNDGLMDSNELDESLKSLMGKISSKLNTKISEQIFSSVPKDRPSLVKLLGEADTSEMLLKAGVFGIFRSGKQSIINDLKNLIQLNDIVSLENLDMDTCPGGIYTTIETDPSQQQVINNLGQSNNLIIQGPPGTGKSQTLTALITNALANGKRTLVVCEKRTAMDIIAKNLEKSGLGDYFISVENVNRDRTSVIDKARSIYDGMYGSSSIDNTELDLALRKYDEAKADVSEHHRSIASLMSKGLGDNKALLGKYWNYRDELAEQEASEIVKTVFYKINFSFENIEFNDINEDLNRIKPEYVSCRTIISHIPKNIIMENGSFALDKKSISDYLTSRSADITQLQDRLRDYHSKLAGQLASIMNHKHETIRLIAIEARRFLSIERKGFNWEPISIALRECQGDTIGKWVAVDTGIKELNLLQDKTDYIRNCMQNDAEGLGETLSSYRKFHEIAQEKISNLKILGIVGLGLAKTSSITSLFSSKQKDIKSLKDDLFKQIIGINKLKKQYPDLLGMPININESLGVEVAESLLVIPSSKQIADHIGSQPTSNYPDIDATDIDSDMSNISYIGAIDDMQFTIFEQLKSALWDGYRSLIDAQFVNAEFLRSFMGMEELDSVWSNSILSTLVLIDSHILDQAQLSDKVSDIVSDFSIEKFTELIDIKQKMLDIVSFGEYHQVYTGYRTIVRHNKLIEILNLANDMVSDTKEALDDIEISFYAYYKWCIAYVSLNTKSQQTLDCFVSSGIDSSLWQAYFSALYFERLVKDSNNERLLNSDLVLNKLMSTDKKIKSLLLGSINARWGTNRKLCIDIFQTGVLRFSSLYNKRGAPGQRRNSLRKIIDRDFNLFTTLFPVIICNPRVSTSLFKLEKDLFDIVLFDEASQLRLEDTYTSLYRGKVKIISGDEHQMPPSDYFQSNSIEYDLEEDDDESMQAQEILNSESLLDYASINGYLKTMLGVHYRSEHQDLIEFSNHAFYKGRLMPIPKLDDYRPIEYIKVNGLYDEHINKDEASNIIEWISSNAASLKMPSIGVATLNLHQAEYIKELISQKRTDDRDFDELMVQLEECGFFVKNLENVQGDERDVMLLSTTFGLNKDGKFIQNFGPLSRKQGYRLLNVLVTRAKRQFNVFTSIPDKYVDSYTDEIDSYGKDGKGILYAYLAYARAVSNGDEVSKQAVLNKLDQQSDVTTDSILGEGLTESPFEEEVVAALEGLVSSDRIKLQYKVGSEKFRIDIVILDPSKSKPMLAVECDGYAYHSSPDAHLYDIYRQKILESKGFKFYRIWSVNWFHDYEVERRRLADKINELDRYFQQ